MIETVAVGTDGSETAARAVEEAFELAERFGARVIVLSAFAGTAGPAAPRLSGTTGEHPDWSSNAAEQVERILAVAEESAAERGLAVSSAMEEGEPGDVLVRLAERHKADVLVVGSKGMDRRLLGSVPNTVTHKAPCSVMVVKTT